jgi:hypothetical protein
VRSAGYRAKEVESAMCRRMAALLMVVVEEQQNLKID